MPLPDTSGLENLRLNIGALRGPGRVTAERAFGLGRAERAMSADLESLQRLHQKEMQGEQLESMEGIAEENRLSTERLAGLNLDFSREQLAQRESEFSRSFGFEGERFGKTFGLEEDRFGEMKRQFDEQMDLQLKQLFQQGEFQEGQLSLEGRRISEAGRGELTSEDFSSLLDQLISGKLELQEGEGEMDLGRLLFGGGRFNPADPYGTNPEGAPHYLLPGETAF